MCFSFVAQQEAQNIAILVLECDFQDFSGIVVRTVVTYVVNSGYQEFNLLSEEILTICNSNGRCESRQYKHACGNEVKDLLIVPFYNLPYVLPKTMRFLFSTIDSIHNMTTGWPEELQKHQEGQDMM